MISKAVFPKVPGLRCFACLVVVFLFGVQGQAVASERGFGNHSLRGQYAVWGTNEGPQGTVAGIGVFNFDGRGTASAVLMRNQPDGYGGRELLEIKAEGTYWVGKDGRGMLSGIRGGPDGNVKDVFVITKSNRYGRASELFVIFGEPGPMTGALPTFRLTRQRGD